MKKRYVQVGVGGRARFFYHAIAAGDFKDTSELVGFCDINQTRMDYANSVLEKEFGMAPVPTYPADKFDDMIRDLKPDIVIVTTVDRTHHKYIIRAMELGCDVVTEKPMTMTVDKCQQIIDAQKRTGRNIRVSFNYRYAPFHTKCREVIKSGVIGDIFSVHFEWLLDTYHGADYFRRWHRDKRNSGGLLVHKSTHHFDLINFWMNTQPKTVFAFGDLNFYGRENAENRGITKFYNRSTDNPMAEGDPFAIDLKKDGELEGLYYNAEKEDGYIRDQSVFGDGISIEDTMGVLVKYKNGAIMTYSLNAYMPYEGYRIAFNGSKGRVEMTSLELPYINGGGTVEGCTEKQTIRVFPIFGEAYDVEVEAVDGGHGGGDPILLNDLFGTPEEDEYNRAANHVDGAMSILTGLAANKSIATGMPVDIDSMIKF